jgi:hypothetical protein
VHWHAVRGPISREMILKSGGDCAEVFGDPALLCPLIYTPPRIGGGGIGIVLHFSHLHLAKEGDTGLISPVRCGADDAKQFINEISRFDYIFSTSLHGLIFANAYGIPARRCVFDEKAASLSGDDMKFQDYWLGAGLPCQEPLSLSGFPDFDAKRFTPFKITQPKPGFNAGRLLQAFPWPSKLADKFRK